MSEEQKTLEGISAPDNYHDLARGFPDREAAVAAIDGFWKEFYELRNKWRLPDVYVIFRLVIGDGETMTALSAGCSLYNEPMTAWAYGYEQAEREAAIAKLAGHGRKMSGKLRKDK
jgi:hypothetical protein